MTTYRFLNTGTQSALLNMAIDESILLHHIRKEAPPTLRVFQWQRPSISLGRFQDENREIELARCQEEGVEVVRRPTGGRAVYHRDEFTYSIVIGKEEGVPSGVVKAYAYLSQGLLSALRKLGLKAEISDERVQKMPSAACFASSTQADLTSNGYKVIGSAQVWKDESLLQQGSFPLDDHAAEFFSYLRFADEQARSVALEQYRKKTTPLHNFQASITWEEVAEAFRSGFSEELEATFEPGELSQSEWELAKELVETKYQQLSWRPQKVKLIEA